MIASSGPSVIDGRARDKASQTSRAPDGDVKPIFDVARIVSYCSQIATLLPGDLVLTGSPAGIGPARGRLLRAGDVMESTITGSGVQRNVCVPESGVAR